MWRRFWPQSAPPEEVPQESERRESVHVQKPKPVKEGRKFRRSRKVSNQSQASSGSVQISTDSELHPKRCTLWRIIVAFWILGLCNNYVYVVMLAAAHDVLTEVEAKEKGISTDELKSSVPYGRRNCTQMSVGAILLADILPTLAVKLTCPFLPFYVHIRIMLSVSTGITSLCLVAFAQSIFMALVGVCFASFNSGLGELTFLAYSTNFVLHSIAGFSSGTGGAGLVGAIAYAGMTEGGLSPGTALLISIIVPIFMAIAFWGILKHPKGYRHICANVPPNSEGETKTQVSISKAIKEKFSFMRKLMPFMIPVGLVYYFEYLINSGLFDKFQYENTSVPLKSQYRWYNVMYQVGVFISRSSVTWVHFKKVWIMSLLQAINFFVLFLDAVFGFIPNIWILFGIILWEGLLGGAAYVNTFYNMSYMIDKEHRLFALSIASVADTFGIVLAGVSAFPVHIFLCNMPFKPSWRWP